MAVICPAGISALEAGKQWFVPVGKAHVPQRNIPRERPRIPALVQRFFLLVP